jgi:hypothetical protein
MTSAFSERHDAARPCTKMRRPPRMSPRRAPVTTRAANAIVYAATTSCSSAPEAWRLVRNEGAVIARIAPSIVAIACPASSITSAPVAQPSDSVLIHGYRTIGASIW